MKASQVPPIETPRRERTWGPFTPFTSRRAAPPPTASKRPALAVTRRLTWTALDRSVVPSGVRLASRSATVARTQAPRKLRQAGNRPYRPHRPHRPTRRGHSRSAGTLHRPGQDGPGSPPGTRRNGPSRRARRALRQVPKVHSKFPKVHSEFPAKFYGITLGFATRPRLTAREAGSSPSGRPILKTPKSVNQRGTWGAARRPKSAPRSARSGPR